MNRKQFMALLTGIVTFGLLKTKVDNIVITPKQGDMEVVGDFITVFADDVVNDDIAYMALGTDDNIIYPRQIKAVNIVTSFCDKFKHEGKYLDCGDCIGNCIVPKGKA